MAQQTAVEWLVSQQKHNKFFDIETIEQAKQIEKEQIIQSWHNGYENQSPMIDEDNCGQTYYTQTYSECPSQS